MGAGLLTLGSTMTCPHGGRVMPVPAGPRPTANGAPLLLATDTYTVAGCPFIPVAPQPCVLVQWVQPSATGSGAGMPTLTEDSVGFCFAADGAMQGPVLIVAAQPAVSGT